MYELFSEIIFAIFVKKKKKIHHGLLIGFEFDSEQFQQSNIYIFYTI